MNEYGYRNLMVWQKGKKLAVDVYRLTKVETIRHDFSLIDQLRRSAVSVPSNIAKGSLAELATQLEIARDVGYLTTAQVEPLISECAESGKMLGALIRTQSLKPRA